MKWSALRAINVQRAREILQQLRDRAEREFVSRYHFAYVPTGLGEADAAIEWLENVLSGARVRSSESKVHSFSGTPAAILVSRCCYAV
jgi:hypothetical protein